MEQPQVATTTSSAYGTALGYLLSQTTDTVVATAPDPAPPVSYIGPHFFVGSDSPSSTRHLADLPGQVELLALALSVGDFCWDTAGSPAPNSPGVIAGAVLDTGGWAAAVQWECPDATMAGTLAQVMDVHCFAASLDDFLVRCEQIVATAQAKLVALGLPTDYRSLFSLEPPNLAQQSTARQTVVHAVQRYYLSIVNGTFVRPAFFTSGNVPQMATVNAVVAWLQADPNRWAVARFYDRVFDYAMAVECLSTQG